MSLAQISLSFLSAAGRGGLQCLTAGIMISFFTYPAVANVITLTVQNPEVPQDKVGIVGTGYGIVVTGLGFDKDGKPVKTTTVQPDPAAAITPVTVKPGDVAKDKRDKLMGALNAKFPELVKNKAIKPEGNDQIVFSDIMRGQAVVFTSTGTPGESSDRLTAQDDPTVGQIGFSGTFDSSDPAGNDAVFTAGVSSDLPNSLGLLDSIVTLSSSQILGMGVASLTGATIADALFAELSKIVPSGLLLTHIDPTLNDGLIFVNYPASTAVSNGGVIFGTSSFAGTVSGAINAEIPEPNPLLLLATGCVGLLGYGWWCQRHTQDLVE